MTLTFTVGEADGIVAKSDEDGAFSIVLRRTGGKTSVLVEADKPAVNRSYDVTILAALRNGVYEGCR